MKVTYKNPWFQSNGNYGPELYTTDAKPTEYKGFRIYNIWDKRFDVVKDGVCVGQYAGMSGAKGLVDIILSGKKPKKSSVERFWYDRSMEYLKTAIC